MHNPLMVPVRDRLAETPLKIVQIGIDTAVLELIDADRLANANGLDIQPRSEYIRYVLYKHFERELEAKP